MASAGVGLVLRANAVEVVEARRTLTGVQVTKYARVPIEGASDAQVVAAIQTALATAGISASRMGVTVPAQDVLLRSFSLPHLPRSEWTTAIQFEARKYIPFKTEELVWGFHAVEERETKQLSVVFAGIRSEAFTRIQTWLKDAGVEPTWIEAPWFSLARAAGDSVKLAAGECLGVVDVEPGAAHLIILKDRIPYLARDVNLAVAGLGPGDAASSSVDPRAEKLLGELRLSVDFFTREHPSTLVSRLVLFGDPQVVGPWCEWLAPQVHCPVETGRISIQPMRQAGVDVGFALAVGLARREFRAGTPRLDFAERLPSPAAAKSKPFEAIEALFSGRLDLDFIRSMARPAMVQAGIAAGAIALLGLVGHHQATALRRQLVTIRQAFPDPGWGLKDQQQQGLQALKPDVEKRLAFLHKIIDQRMLVSKKLEALAKALPDGIWLEGLDYQDRIREGTDQSQPSLILRGACYLVQPGNELNLISELVQRIRKDQEFFRGFSTAQLGQITQAEDRAQHYSYRVFQLNCRSERGVL